MTPVPVHVTLDHWSYWRMSDDSTIERYSLMYEGKAVLTLGTEVEARRAARLFGWVVAATDSRPSGTAQRAMETGR